jgi:hypothetical protein
MRRMHRGHGAGLRIKHGAPSPRQSPSSLLSFFPTRCCGRARPHQRATPSHVHALRPALLPPLFPRCAEYGPGALVPKNASVTVRIKPPPAISMGGTGGGGGSGGAYGGGAAAASAAGHASSGSAAPRSAMCVGAGRGRCRGGACGGEEACVCNGDTRVGVRGLPGRHRLERHGARGTQYRRQNLQCGSSTPRRSRCASGVATAALGTRAMRQPRRRGRDERCECPISARRRESVVAYTVCDFNSCVYAGAVCA